MGVQDRNPQTERFIKLLTSHQNKIYAYIMSLVSNYNDADDVLQETSQMMWQRFDEFSPGTDFVAWATTIAYYRILEFRRKKSRNVLNEKIFRSIYENMPDHLNDSNEYLHALPECLKKLKSSDQNLVRLIYLQDLPVKEAAVRIDRTVQSIYMKIAKIHSLLLNCIKRQLRA